QIAVLAEQVSKSGPVRCNHIKLLGDTTMTAHQIIEDIDASKETCHLLFYIWLDDAIGTAVGEALIRAAGRGVACRVLVDAVGSRAFLKSDLTRSMRNGGVQVVAALPANPLRTLFSRVDLRNHRKLVIIDDRVAWTGSQNMADASFAPKPKYAPWVDCAIRLTGPVVKEIQILFVEDWYLDTDDFLEEHLNRECEKSDGNMIAQVVATGPNFFTEAASQLVQACIQCATAELVLTTPYFVPDAASTMNLAVAARRGVKVDLVVPHRNDSKLVALASRALYRPLLEAGVRIHEFTGGLLHAKTITVDRETAFITSANLDRRSFNLNFEAGVLVYDTDLASELRFLQQSYLNKSILIDRDAWLKRPTRKRILENSAGLLSPLL
ncbi:MAG: cardiolipin synthase, partial [Phycisphaerales bacterium]|nr:cardiolipin synthase [Phycisphaerales bacterium]